MRNRLLGRGRSSASDLNGLAEEFLAKSLTAKGVRRFVLVLLAWLAVSAGGLVAGTVPALANVTDSAPARVSSIQSDNEHS